MTHFPITFAVTSTARPGAGHSAEEVTEMVSYLIAIVIVCVSPLAVPVATTVFYAVRVSMRDYAAESGLVSSSRSGSGRRQISAASSAGKPNMISTSRVTRSAASASSRSGWSCNS